jgi:hypothetical protein
VGSEVIPAMAIDIAGYELSVMRVDDQLRLFEEKIVLAPQSKSSSRMERASKPSMMRD